ncbi:hypothetical protein DFP73DRAFT_326606 [Morchella snyderi]|nr:hypothetical protein DFP73DRAFT_326606 [Morchella snyderi]
MSSTALALPSSWHIPELEGPSHPRPEIPCLCKARDYDKKGFLEFPARKGWTIDIVKGPVRLDGSESSPERIAQFLQAWLFFGMLHEILLISGRDVDLNLFIRYQGMDPVITTAPLRQEFGDMIDRGADRATVAHKELEMKNVFRKVWTFFLTYLDTCSPTRWRITDVLCLDTTMSILILAESLRNAAIITLKVSADSSLKDVGFFLGINPLKERMLSAGWCINTITMLHEMLDHTGLYIASLLRVSGTSNRQSHHLCTPASCEANFVSEATYETSHTEACRAQGSSSCPHISVDVPKVCSILRRGGTPVVNIVPYGPDNKQIKLEVVESSPYVAMSHVWAHGLGNTKANSLPRCQLFHLRAVTRELVLIGATEAEDQRLEQPPIWMDTLCIPVHPDLKKDRKAAIVGLAKTFREASQVLVLDADIQTCPKNAGRMERGTRLLFSGWMRRLWTYQEAVISGEGSYCWKLQIQFSDGALPFHLMGRKQGFLSLCHTQKAINMLYHRLPLVGDNAFRFRTLARALRYRSTSRMEDESICLASVLGYDLKELSQTECPDRRMALFYSYIPEMPADLLFLHKENLEIDGYRWAPKSFLKQSRTLNSLGLHHKAIGARDGNGLYVTFPGFRITEVTLPKDPGNHFYIKRSHESQLEGGIEPIIPSFGRNTTPEDLRSYQENRVAFDEFVHDTEQLAVIQSPSTKPYYSVLVAILREENDTIYCRFIRLVDFNVMPVRQVPRGSIVVQHLPAEQRWCVG